MCVEKLRGTFVRDWLDKEVFFFFVGSRGKIIIDEVL